MTNVILQNHSKFYYMDFFHNGKRIKKSTKKTDKAEALKVAIAEHARLDAETVLKAQEATGLKTIRLADAFDTIIAGVQGSTARNYLWAKNKLFGIGAEYAGKFHLSEDLMLHELTQEDLDAHIAARRKEGVKPNTINVELRVLRAVVNHHSGSYKQPLIKGIKTVKGFVKTRYVSDAEETQILKKLSEMEGRGASNAYALAVFLLDTGVRLSEALNTEWQMLNLEAGEYEVYRIKTQSHDIIPLSPRLVDILKRRRNYEKPFVEMDYSVKVLRKVLHDICNKNETINKQKGKVTPHALRDTFATRLVKEGMTTHELANLLGHTTAAMSQKYSHLENRDVASKARALMAERHKHQQPTV